MDIGVHLYTYVRLVIICVSTLTLPAYPCYRLPLARLWLMQSIWQFSAELPPPLLHAETWSASISVNFHILLLLAAWPTAQSGQFDVLLVSAAVVCVA